MVNNTQSGAQVRARILAAMQIDVGISEKMAEPIADSIMRCLAGEQLYFPSLPRRYPIEKIADALQGGATVRSVIKNFDLSRSKLYELFPGGLPGRKRT